MYLRLQVHDLKIRIQDVILFNMCCFFVIFPFFVFSWCLCAVSVLTFQSLHMSCNTYTVDCNAELLKTAEDFTAHVNTWGRVFNIVP